jgi:hypothetical protein
MSPSNPPDSKHPRKSKQHTQEDKAKPKTESAPEEKKTKTEEKWKKHKLEKMNRTGGRSDTVVQRADLLVAPPLLCLHCEEEILDLRVQKAIVNGTRYISIMN